MVTWCMDALCFRVEHQKAHKGIGEIDLFGSVAIGHKTLKGVQRVYAWPFPKRLFGASATTRTLCLFDHWDQITPYSISVSPDNGWYCTIVVRTDVMGSVPIMPFCPSWSRTVSLIQRQMTG